jgi:hypothetical protein
MQLLFQEEMEWEAEEKAEAGLGQHKGVSSLVFKKNGSTLSLSKNSSKRRL